jgi:hypothetical protein
MRTTPTPAMAAAAGGGGFVEGDARLISQFIVDWRKHFIDTVNPRHMPTGWRIDNPVVCGSQFLILDRGLEGPMLRSW